MNIRWQIIIFVLLGFLAGLSGGLVIFNIVSRNFTLITGDAVVREAPVELNTQGLDVERMGREMNQMVVEFYRPRAVSAEPAANILLASNLLGRGSVITADGWILTHQSAFGGYDPRAVLVVHNGLLVKAATIVKDKTTGLVFIKTSIKNVPSVKLGTLAAVLTGEAVAIGGARADWRPAFIVKQRYEFLLHPKDAIHTSEDLFRVGILSDTNQKQILGAPVISRRNEVVGVMAQTAYGIVIMPVEYILSVKDMVFGTAKIERPYLGVTYIHLPKNTIGQENFNQNGALVLADPSLGAPGVVQKSPAAVAGILPGDLIISVNDEEINQSKTLGELLLPYKKGDILEVKLERKEEVKVIKLTLGSVLTSLTSTVKLRQ